MDERRTEESPHEPPRVERERTVITSRDNGSGGLLIALVVLIAIVVALFVVFGGFGSSDEAIDVNVNVATPEVQAPELDLPDVQLPDLETPQAEAPDAPGETSEPVEQP